MHILLLSSCLLAALLMSHLSPVKSLSLWLPLSVYNVFLYLLVVWVIHLQSSLASHLLAVGFRLCGWLVMVWFASIIWPWHIFQCLAWQPKHQVVGRQVVSNFASSFWKVNIIVSILTILDNCAFWIRVIDLDKNTIDKTVCNLTYFS